jgi:Tfp pilus assembly protein FimT
MNEKGVTLVELVLVFVIIAILAALMVPAIWSSFLPSYRLRSATRDIVSTMRTAQLRAISSNNPFYQVNFTAGSSYILQHQNTGGVLISDGVGQSLPSGIAINTANLPNAKAVFYPNSNCSTGSITLSYQKNGVTMGQKTILLSPATGKITIQ